MRTLLTGLFVVSLLYSPLAAIAQSAAVAPPPESASTILAEYKAASGGSAWDTVTSLHIVSGVAQGGLTGTNDEYDDVQTGRNVQSLTLGPVKQVGGYDGASAWQQDMTGQSHVVTSVDELQSALTSAYTVSLAYWYPSRRPGTVTLLRQATVAGRGFDVLQVSPRGGWPFEMWIDSATHLLDHIVEPTASETDTTTFGDYRQIPGTTLLYPYRQQQSTGEEKFNVTIMARRIEIDPAIPASRFAMPAASADLYTIQGGAASTTVPFVYRDEHVMIPVLLNGHPLDAYLDSGGAYVSPKSAAARAHLMAQGSLPANGIGAKTVAFGIARASSLSIGGLSVGQPMFLVMEMPALHSDIVVGYELFERFAVHIDYDRKTVTFTRPDRFVWDGKGVAVPMKLNQNTPQVAGSVDGYSGTFTIDTGSGGSVDLNAAFVKWNKLITHYRPKFSAVDGWGIGGPQTAFIARSKTLQLGGAVVKSPLTTLQFSIGGAASNLLVAGNIGEGVLHRFNLTFDYPHGRIIFQPNSHYRDPDGYPRAGIIPDPNVPRMTVYQVIPSSPAAMAGIKPGDIILKAGGRPIPSSQSDDVLRDIFLQKGGTKVPLVLESGGKIKRLTVTLRDLL